ncbi:hypothetical protein F4W66_24640 (plasmid) [Escherichia coli]|nr:hypothetical protein F4W66_24640 [Escherichia coli]
MPFANAIARDCIANNTQTPGRCRLLLHAYTNSPAFNAIRLPALSVPVYYFSVYSKHASILKVYFLAKRDSLVGRILALASGAQRHESSLCFCPAAIANHNDRNTTAAMRPAIFC